MNVLNIDYENIGQTEGQFLSLYGSNKEKWSGAAKATYDVLFNDAYRNTAAKEYDIKSQTIHAFLVRNRDKHLAMLNLAEQQRIYESL